LATIERDKKQVQSKQLLSGDSVSIEYTGPIALYLGKSNKCLMIIRAEEEKALAAKYLLIDTETYNPEARIGYKAFSDGSKVLVGSAISDLKGHGFKFPPDVAPFHLAINVKDNKITIRNHSESVVIVKVSNPSSNSATP
ncbi:MAG: hypothetical protein QW458_03335, partial [Candidatus Micrarchaeaceae archaeon]